MPFKSEKQRRYMYANEPEIAKKWSKKYGNKILKAKGGADASKADFGVNTPGPGDTGGEGGYTHQSTNQFGAKGSSPTSTGGPQVQVRTGPVQVPTIGPFTYAFNKISQGLYNRKNLKDARQNDILGGEMLTTGQKTTGPATIPDNNNNNKQLCPDGTYPPCKTPVSQSFEHGGEIVVSSNVDKSLL
jgi:hypothetical protein